MDDGLKQRLVGAIVLVVLAVIILPAVLREPEGTASRDLPSPIPDRPKFEVVSSIVKDQDVESERVKLQKRLLKERTEYAAEDSAVGLSDPADVKKEPQSSKSARAAIAQTQPSELSSAEARETLVRQAAAPLAPAWSVQLASFARRNKAEQLQQQLLSDNYRAYVESKMVKGKRWYRVLVGPDIQKEKAVRLLAQLEQDQQMKGILVRFRP